MKISVKLFFETKKNINFSLHIFFISIKAANNTVYVAPDPPQEQTLGCHTSPKCVPGSASLQHQDYYYFITACLKLREEGEGLHIRKELK